MYGQLFGLNHDPVICERVSHSAALAYAAMIYNADESGVVEAWSNILAALNIDLDAWRSLEEELLQAGLIEKFMEEVPIAEIGAGLILGSVRRYRVLGYELPETFARLSPEAWKKVRREVFKRDGHVCQYCGNTGPLECDHVVPISRGGTNELGNLVTACRSCNRSKRAKIIEAAKS